MVNILHSIYSTETFLLATRVIRTQHKIIGSMIGALPSQPRQSTMLGMPLLLLPEETTLLMEKGSLCASFVYAISLRMSHFCCTIRVGNVYV